MEHTKEPWSYGEDNDGWYVEKDGTQIAHGLTETDTRRIVVCVNICEGLDTELLEAGISAMKSTVWTRMAIGRLRQQRDELLAQKFSEEPLRRQIAELRELGRFREKHFLTGSPEVYDDPSAAFHKFACEMHDALKVGTEDVGGCMSDLISRLKKHTTPGHPGIIDEAIEEIARLRNIEEAAVSACGNTPWQGDEWYSLMCALDKALKGE